MIGLISWRWFLIGEKEDPIFEKNRAIFSTTVTCDGNNCKSPRHVYVDDSWLRRDKCVLSDRPLLPSSSSSSSPQKSEDCCRRHETRALSRRVLGWARRVDAAAALRQCVPLRMLLLRWTITRDTGTRSYKISAAPDVAS